ncbi:MAG: DUF4019 domain-containing protein [Pseudomonadota bacterium]
MPRLSRTAWRRLWLQLVIAMSIGNAGCAATAPNSPPPPAPPAPPAEPAAPVISSADRLQAAGRFLALIDAQRWNDSWALVGPEFQQQVPQASWTQQVSAVRAPLGDTATRRLLSEQSYERPAAQGGGAFEMLRFLTRSTSERQFIETVTLTQVDGAWQIAGYFIKNDD